MSRNTADNDGMHRRRLLGALAVTVTGSLAGCNSTGDGEKMETTSPESAFGTTRAATATETPTETPEPTETTTTTPDTASVEDVRKARQALTEREKRTAYQSGIPSPSDYELDYGRVQQENETRREQLIDITATVGDQYNDWVEGNHAVMNAIHNLDWMGWENDNIVNIVTRYASQPGEHVLANYSTEDGGRNLDGTTARDSVSGEGTYMEDIPDSEVMDGDVGNFLVTDIEELAANLERNDWDPDNYKATRLELQSIIPGVKGPSHLGDRPRRDRGVVFDSDAIQYIGENYDESAEAAYEVTEEALEIHMSSMPVIESGRSVGVTAGEDGLKVDAVYSQEEAEEKLREPIEL